MQVKNITYLFTLGYLYKIGFAFYLLILLFTGSSNYDRGDLLYGLVYNTFYIGLYMFIATAIFLLLYRFFAGEISSRPFKVLYITFIASFIIELIVGKIINSY